MATSTSINALLLVTAPLPSIAVSFASYTLCRQHDGNGTWLVHWCKAYQHPLLALNILFFFNVTIMFWIISICQHGSTWLIDPYWTLLPPLIYTFYATHAHAPHPTSARQLAIPAMLALWSLRLTHSYFRRRAQPQHHTTTHTTRHRQHPACGSNHHLHLHREEWRLGAWQDWRFDTMQQHWGPKRWRWASFWAAFASQHVMLVGLTTPLYMVVMKEGEQGWTVHDTLAAALALLGMCFCAVVDPHTIDQN